MQSSPSTGSLGSEPFCTDLEESLPHLHHGRYSLFLQQSLSLCCTCPGERRVRLCPARISAERRHPPAQSPRPTLCSLSLLMVALIRNN